ncbi:MAG: T9SS type A sorting domain-containing protein, partial [Dysgonamonadaceae bacterium]|nr:T9SS type A sorting domain-containing protein [Dysgonamonadaceae bacterium]
VRQGDNFLLSYPTSATSVSVYNVAGQRMGEYKLDAKGKYTLPVTDLAKGIYILKFNGTNSAVKIIR